jgi:hypothetical protein
MRIVNFEVRGVPGIAADEYLEIFMASRSDLCHHHLTLIYS